MPSCSGTTQIPVSGIVRGDPLVVGMCGFDMFAQCIVEVCSGNSAACNLFCFFLVGSSLSSSLYSFFELTDAVCV